MKSLHTPGPWRIQGNGTLNHPVTNRALTTVRIETSLGTFEVLDETNEPDANARIIAASPSLFEFAQIRAGQGDPLAKSMLDSLGLSY